MPVRAKSTLAVWGKPAALLSSLQGKPAWAFADEVCIESYCSFSALQSIPLPEISVALGDLLEEDMCLHFSPSSSSFILILTLLLSSREDVLKANKEQGDVNYHQLQAEDENIWGKRFEWEARSSSTLKDAKKNHQTFFAKALTWH